MDRRSFIFGSATVLAAPAIVRLASLMPVRGIIVPVQDFDPTMWKLDILKFAKPAFVYDAFEKLTLATSP